MVVVFLFVVFQVGFIGKKQMLCDCRESIKYIQTSFCTRLYIGMELVGSCEFGGFLRSDFSFILHIGKIAN